MKKLFEQIVKFGIVGAIAFVIDYAVLFVLVQFLHMDSIIAATISFTVSVIFNYLASMKYVFVGRADQSKQTQFIIFIVKICILFINILPVTFIFYIDPFYQRWYHVDFKRYLISVYPDLLLPGFKNRGNGDCYGMELCFKKDFP